MRLRDQFLGRDVDDCAGRKCKRIWQKGTHGQHCSGSDDSGDRFDERRELPYQKLRSRAFPRPATASKPQRLRGNSAARFRLSGRWPRRAFRRPQSQPARGGGNATRREPLGDIVKRDRQHQQCRPLPSGPHPFGLRAFLARVRMREQGIAEPEKNSAKEKTYRWRNPARHSWPKPSRSMVRESDQKLAAIITPAANPSIISSSV